MTLVIGGVRPRRPRPSPYAVACSQCRVPIRVVFNGEDRRSRPRPLSLNAMPSADGIWKFDPVTVIATYASAEDFADPEVNRYAAHAKECAGPLPGQLDYDFDADHGSTHPVVAARTAVAMAAPLPPDPSLLDLVDRPPVWLAPAPGTWERLVCAVDPTHRLGVVRHPDGEVDAYCTQCRIATPTEIAPSSSDQGDTA